MAVGVGARSGIENVKFGLEVVAFRCIDDRGGLVQCFGILIGADQPQCGDAQLVEVGAELELDPVDLRLSASVPHG